MLRRKSERGLVLWIGLGFISLASVWLQRRRNQIQRDHQWQVQIYKNRRRVQDAVQSDDELDVHRITSANANLHDGNPDRVGDNVSVSCNDEDELATLPPRPVDTLFMKAINLIRNIVFWLWLSNYIAVEVSELYLESSTVLGWLSSKIAEYLMNHRRFTTARWLLELSLWWNSCWIAEPASIVEALHANPCGADPVAANLRQLALLASKLNNQRLLTRFAAALSARTFVSRKLTAAQGWDRLKHRLQTTARSLIIPTPKG